MPFHFRAVAVDYDGTLTRGERPDPAVLDELTRARRGGRAVVLVTGRILSDLDAVFPEAARFFDAIVGENGATVRFGVERERQLAPPVPRELLDALLRDGAPARQGSVLIATKARHAHLVLEEVARLGSDAVLVRNREELMVLPAGVTKATGLTQALSELGISPHSCVAVGDAENDQALLDAVELGVAVGNAVPALKARADIVLASGDGEGVRELLRGPVLAGDVRREPARWRVGLGTFDDGTPATIPGSRANVLICGESGTGKSYLMGLVAEELLHLGYVIAVLDLEGDHESLADRMGVHLFGGAVLPSPDQIASVRLESRVLDLSLLDTGARRAYARDALAALARSRRARGVPHWVFIDEAHLPLAVEPERDEVAAGGLCAVTWRPDSLCAAIRSGFDVRIEALTARRATLARSGEMPRPFTVGRRRSAHVRHRHKYTEARLAPHHRFFFRMAAGPTGRSAGNVDEFVEEVRHADPAVLIHHASHHDFSGWFRDVFQDRPLAARVWQVESHLEDPAALRDGMLHAVITRYGAP